MNRAQLAHILRAAATIVDADDLLVIGSQAILASYDEDELPEQAIASIEADVAFLNDPDAAKADLVDGAIGELSPFHESFGVYAQGVEVSTATLPPGWRSRLVRFDRSDTGAAQALCLDPHDLVVSKLLAGREKDLRFAGALLGAQLINVAELRQRVDELRAAGTLESIAQRRLEQTVDSFESRGC